MRNQKENRTYSLKSITHAKVGVVSGTKRKMLKQFELKRLRRTDFKKKIYLKKAQREKEKKNDGY
jgi:hypothetical protein